MLRLSAILRAFNGTASVGPLPVALHQRRRIRHQPGPAAIADGVQLLPSGVRLRQARCRATARSRRSLRSRRRPRSPARRTSSAASSPQATATIFTSRTGRATSRAPVIRPTRGPHLLQSVGSVRIQASSSSLSDYINLAVVGRHAEPHQQDRAGIPLDTAYPVYNLPTATAGNITYGNGQDRKRDRVKGALWLCHTPEFQIQR